MNIKIFNPTLDDVHWYATPTDDASSDSSPITVCAMRMTHGICAPLILSNHGQVHPLQCNGNSVTVGMRCMFSCDVGYQLTSEENTVVCQANGLWSGSVPTCAVVCEALDDVPHGRIHPDSCIGEHENPGHGSAVGGVLSGVQCTVECDNGFMMVGGPGILTCLGDGSWNSPQPACKRMCPLLSTVEYAVPSDASCHTEQKYHGQVCSFRCFSGYGVPRAEKSCKKSSNTSVLLGFTDSSEYCSDERKREEGYEEEKEKEEGYEVEVHLSCMLDGKWSAQLPMCQPLCPALVLQEHGYIEPLSCVEQPQMVGKMCNYNCNDGYTAHDKTSNFTCIEGKWIPSHVVTSAAFDIDIFDNYIHESPLCEIYCPPLVVPSLNQSLVTPASCLTLNNAIATVCEIECHSDYVLKGQTSVVCMEDGTWDTLLGTCIQKCPSVTAPPNGEVRPLACSTASMGDGAVCSFACTDKYSLDGATTILCNGSGNWSAIPPTCKRRCLPIPRFYNGYASPISSCFTEHITSGEICHFACADNFLLIGQDQITCLESGEWEGSPPTCNRICHRPQVPHGSISCTHSNIQLNITSALTWGSICRLQCIRNYAPSHNAGFICGNDGEWRPTIPHCIETGVPMYILQTLGEFSLCLVEHEAERSVVKLSQSECLVHTSYASNTSWHWLGSYNIQNAHSGYCITVRSSSEGEKLRTAPCNTDDNLQHWDCSVDNAFQVVLRGTDLSPSTFYKNVDAVVLQKWSDAHSYFSTFDLVTLSASSICSRRPGGICPPLHNAVDGKVEPEECKSNDVVAGQQCSYECHDDDAYLSGSAYTICMGNGLWSSPPPACVKSCHPLSEVPFLPKGTYYLDDDCVFDSPSVGKSCDALCMSGYDLVGNATRECLTTGQWSPVKYNCQRTCPSIFGLLHGTVDPMPCRSGICSFKCRPGYVLVGSETYNILCMDDGTWNNILPKCIRDPQFQIIFVESNSGEEMCLTLPASTSDPLIKSSCSRAEAYDGSQLFKWNGDLLINPESGLCLRGNVERWGNVSVEGCWEEDSLQKWDCGARPGVYDNALRLKDTSLFLDYGSTVDVSRSNEKEALLLLEVVMETEYVMTSRWLARHYYGQGTVCSMKNERQCAPFQQVLHGTVFPHVCLSHDNIVKGLICQVKCLFLDYGSTVDVSRSNEKEALHLLEVVMETEYVMTSRWLARHYYGQGTVCSMKNERQCAPFQQVLHGTVFPHVCLSHDNIVKGLICQVKCDQGYTQLHTDRSVCLNDGTWSTPIPACTGIYQCPALPVLDSTIMVEPSLCKATSVTDGVVCTFMCDDHYKLHGPQTIQCETPGVWSEPPPSCNAQCEGIPYIDGGSVSPFTCYGPNNDPGTTCSVSCDPKFRLIGSDRRKCKDNGMWSGEDAMCVVFCPPLDLPLSGYVYPDRCRTSENFEENSCNFQCVEDYVMIGNSEVTCVDGSWDRDVPQCVPMSLCPRINENEPGVKEVLFQYL
nr:sushi, von Willebrand factor type A, EGF and pentraxin domain-containing protein 1-like [Ciona intestinalis]|eukprot:XP_026692812.1 sushi, von Willebrand factor type A, EGF and pentraxin domain-containing protein 1-like [Ciona intestinalis]